MGKHEPMSAKAIATKIKAKGLQKIKYYCEMCKKQCRDANGFKCHITSESHQRQALIVSENPEKFVSGFSEQFLEGFMYILKTRYRTKRILANTVFQEYIKERDHIHMNGTRWTSLSEFANWLGEHGIVEVDQSERGVMITYIDNDPETLRRQELAKKRAQETEEAAERVQKEIEQQRMAAEKIYRKVEESKPQLESEPIQMAKVPASEVINNVEVVERPQFKVQKISLKTAAPSSYRPPPPKRKLTTKELEQKRKRKKEGNQSTPQPK